jgi:excisionase family DNA binding protein
MEINYYTISEIAALTKMTKDSCWRWVRENKLTSQKIAGAVYIIPKTKNNLAFIKSKVRK